MCNKHDLRIMHFKKLLPFKKKLLKCIISTLVVKAHNRLDLFHQKEHCSLVQLDKKNPFVDVLSFSFFIYNVLYAVYIIMPFGNFSLLF